MKKYLSVVILIFVLLAGLVVVACDKTEPLPEFFVTYTAGDGGYIDGDSIQTITSGENATTVTAKPIPGYRFAKWLDTDSTNPVRTDGNIIGKITAHAEFEKIVLTVRYRPTTRHPNGSDAWENNGGYVEGHVEQTVNYGDDASKVVAKPYAGFIFVGWSDGSTETERLDRNIKADLTVNVKFVEVSQQLTYQYNGATDNNTEQNVTVTYDELKHTAFAIPEKEGFQFQGWYLEPEFINKAVNRVGQILIHNELLTKNTGSLYAKWIPQDIIVYPVLMVFVTEAKATLVSNYKRASANTIYDFGIKYNIDVDYKMSAIERQICELIHFQFSKYSNEMLDGIVYVEVDTYFMVEPIGTESFSQGMEATLKLSYDVFADKIPEVGPMLAFYRSVLTTFGMNDYGCLLYDGAGTAGEKYASLPLDGFLYGSITNNMRFERLFDLDESKLSWDAMMSIYLHEFTHTIEAALGIDDILMGYHTVGGIHSHEGIESLESTRLYLRREAFLNGQNVGIPHYFWTGEIDIMVRYLARPYAGGWVTFNNGDPLDTVASQYVRYGGEANEVTAVPKAGYRFVKWSDGVTTATRKDTNIISRLNVEAIFEKIE